MNFRLILDILWANGKIHLKHKSSGAKKAPLLLYFYMVGAEGVRTHDFYRVKVERSRWVTRPLCSDLMIFFLAVQQRER